MEDAITRAQALLQKRNDNQKETIQMVTLRDIYPTPLDVSCAHTHGYEQYQHLKDVQQILMKCWENKKSGAISMPSRFGKSETTIAWIAWLIMQHPELKIIILTHSQRLSMRFNSRVRGIIEHLAPDLLDNKLVNTKEFFETVAGGYVQTASPGSGISGYGASFIVVDDLLKSSNESLSEAVQGNIEEFMDSVISTRLEPFYLDGDNSTYYAPFIVAIGTLYGTDDWLYQHHEDCEDGYSMKLSALDDNGETIWPEVWSTEALLAKKKKMSSSNWQAMYEADPLIRGGNYFKDTWLSVEESPRELGPYKSTGLFIDPAISTNDGADETVITLARQLHDNRLYIEKVWHHRKSMFDNIEFIAQLYNMFHPDIFKIEAVGAFEGLVEGLQRFGIPVMKWLPGMRDKKSRIINQLEAPLETGMLCFNQDVLDDDDIMKQYKQFPNVNHDDILDCWAIAVENMIGMRAGNPYTEGRTGYEGSQFMSGENRERRRQRMLKEQMNNPYSISYG